jgi:hypothetical protein
MCRQFNIFLFAQWITTSRQAYRHCLDLSVFGPWTRAKDLPQSSRWNDTRRNGFVTSACYRFYSFVNVWRGNETRWCGLVPRPIVPSDESAPDPAVSRCLLRFMFIVCFLFFPSLADFCSAAHLQIIRNLPSANSHCAVPT